MLPSGVRARGVCAGGGKDDAPTPLRTESNPDRSEAWPIVRVDPTRVRVFSTGEAPEVVCRGGNGVLNRTCEGAPVVLGDHFIGAIFASEAGLGWQEDGPLAVVNRRVPMQSESEALGLARCGVGIAVMNVDL